jgi:DNA excision repair protein ERCC-3
MDDLVKTAGDAITRLQNDIDRLKSEYTERVQELSKLKGINLEDGSFLEFLQRYWVTWSKGDDWYVAVPRWIDFQIGRLDHVQPGYNIFVVNKYTQWLGEMPEEIRGELNIPTPEDVFVTDGVLSFKNDHEPVIAQRYGNFLTSVGKGRARIRRGKEFDLIAEIIDNGSLPFRPQQVNDEDRREPMVKFTMDGKHSYQNDAYKEFLKWGAIGLFWMTGSGKSFLTMACMDSLKGRKLLVVPRTMLIEQWKEYLQEYAPRLLEETDIITYNAYNKIKDNTYIVTCFDECNRLPAPTFSKFATIDTKYRLGLSATPFREDGKENYIFALTGKPIGMDWKEIAKLLGKSFHEVNVYIVKNFQDKIRMTRGLVDPEKKTLVFCDGIEQGKKIAAALKAPFIYGASSKRMKTIQENKVIVTSRVADFGVSIKDLEHLVEVDFLYGSRMQEVQRTGRLLHSEIKKSKCHDIIFTEEEFYKYRKRLHGLVERGFKIDIRAPGGIGKLSKARESGSGRRSSRVRVAQNQSRTAPPKLINNDSATLPLLDERTTLNQALIIVLLKTPYAKANQGLSTGDITKILNASHIKYNNATLRGLMKRMFDNRTIDGARVGAKNRKYYIEATIT